MKWPKYDQLRRELEEKLTTHSNNKRCLLGIQDPKAREVLALQFVASTRREVYYQLVQAKPCSVNRTDPNHQSFDAERAVAFHMRNGDIDEAGWLIFLMTHFGRHAKSGWLRLRDVYGRLGEGRWSWKDVCTDPSAFNDWMAVNSQKIRGNFSNHRKYESMRPDARRSVSKAVRDYVNWIGIQGHAQFLSDANSRSGNDLFDTLFKEMKVCSFGRLAKFDYLMLLSRYNLASLIPNSAYLSGATGPHAGVSLLFTGSTENSTSSKTLQKMLDELDEDLVIGMEVLEDALCNWQKSPLKFEHFKG